VVLDARAVVLDRRRLEVHEHDRRVRRLGLAVRQALDRVALDVLELLEHADEHVGDVAPALLVERHRGAAEVRLPPREPARRRGVVHEPAERRERRADHGVLDDVGQPIPRLIGDVGARDELVVVLDRPPPRRGADEPDQAERLELADVVADVPERDAQLGRELARARRVLLEQAQDLNPQRMCEGLHYSLV
jgi:hypothetical protein